MITNDCECWGIVMCGFVRFGGLPSGRRIPTKQYKHGRPPLLFGERVGVRGNIRLRWSFRSLYVPCYSVTTLPVNVPGWLTATTLATRAPGKKIVATRCPQLIPFGFRVGRDEASMQVAPSRRIHAPRPGLQETLRRFSAGPWRRGKSFISMD